MNVIKKMVNNYCIYKPNGCEILEKKEKEIEKLKEKNRKINDELYKLENSTINY